MTVDLQSHFDTFDERISLPQPAIERIESAWTTLAAFLTARLGLPDSDVFLQGSYVNGTAVRPVEGGEYDVDVIVVMAEADESADDALDRLEDLLRSDGRYRDRIVAKKPCIRLEYADDAVGSFHVDVVPVRRTGGYSPSQEAPRRGEGWHGTAPAEYTEWCRVQGSRFAKTVKALKRWRDEEQSVRNAIKSIVLQVLVAEYMPQEPDDARRLAATIEAMHSALANLSQAPVVTNPVLRSENLARRWTATAFKEFVAELEEARGNAHRAVTTSDPVEAIDAWQEVLGDAFPGASTQAMGIRLADDSHARTYRFEGWTRHLDPTYGVRVTASHTRGKRATRFYRYDSGGPLLFHGRKLRFKAEARGPADVEIWWQVANTGLAARGAGGLRGEFFKARRLNKAPSPDPKETWEDTSYTGAHWIRAVLVKEGVVVAESDKFVVNIYNRGQRFGL